MKKNFFYYVFKIQGAYFSKSTPQFGLASLPLLNSHLWLEVTMLDSRVLNSNFISYSRKLQKSNVSRF